MHTTESRGKERSARKQQQAEAEAARKREINKALHRHVMDGFAQREGFAQLMQRSHKGPRALHSCMYQPNVHHLRTANSSITEAAATLPCAPLRQWAKTWQQKASEYKSDA
jgi:hypothetical protein